jgi:hypothetical protein
MIFTSASVRQAQLSYPGSACSDLGYRPDFAVIIIQRFMDAWVKQDRKWLNWDRR